MDGGTLHSIGDLARRTGLTVKTIRSWSDRGIVAATSRSPAGHRLYDDGALSRLELVRTLRDLGLGLAAIRRVMDRELTLPEVAAAHAEALDVQIRVLRRRRAVLAAVAGRGSTLEETHLMHRLAMLSEDERRNLVGDFLDAAFGGLGADAAFAGVRRSMTPELPSNPEPEQVAAWVELAELCADPDFRAAMRRIAGAWVAESGRGSDAVPRPDLVATVLDRFASAVAAGVDPAAPETGPMVAGLTAHYAAAVDRPEDAGLRRRLLIRLESLNDPRRERYVQLVAVINGWHPVRSSAPVLDWSVRALRATTAAGAA